MSGIDAIAFDGVTDTARLVALDEHPERALIEALLEAQQLVIAPAGARRAAMTVYRDERCEGAARAVRSDVHSSVEQLLLRCGARWSRDERLRAIAEHRAWRAEWPFDGVRPSLILCACPEEHLSAAIDALASDRPEHRVHASRRWVQRAFDGEPEPRLAAAGVLAVSRRRPDAWMRAFVASRGRFARSIELTVHCDRKNGELVRAALEQLEPDSVEGLTLTASDGVELGSLAPSMPEGLRSLSVFCALDEDAQRRLASSSALRSARRLSYSSRSASVAGMLSGPAFESLEALSIVSFATPADELCQPAVLRRLPALRSLALRSCSVSDAQLEALLSSVAPGGLRSLVLRVDGLSARGRAALVTHAALRSLESLTIAEGYAAQDGVESALDTIAREGRFDALASLALPRFGWAPEVTETSIVAASTSEATRSLRSLKLFNVQASGLDALARAQRGPALEALEIEADEAQWRGAANPFVGRWTRALRRLTVRGATDSARLCEALASSDLRALIGLEIATGVVDATAIEALSFASFAPGLRALSLMGCAARAGIARALCEAPWARSLDRLLLSASELDEDEQWLLRRTFGPALLLAR